MARKTIGLLTETVAAAYYIRLWNALADSVRRQGWDFIAFAGGVLRFSPREPFNYQRNSVYRLVHGTGVDGLIISGTIKNFIGDDEWNEFLSSYNHLPIVLIPPSNEPHPGILVDNTSGMRAVVSHLVNDHGCRRLVFYCGPEGNPEAVMRKSVFLDVLKANKIVQDQELIRPCDFVRVTAYNDMCDLLSRRKVDFDGVVASNDDMAIGVIEALQERGFRVPEDVAVTGFDDLEESKFTTPPITTVVQPIDLLGQMTARMLIDMMGGKKVEHRSIIQTELVVRQSCGCFIHPQKKFCVVTQPSETMHVKGNHSTLSRRILNNLAKVKEDLPSVPDILVREFVTAFVDEITGVRKEVFLHTVNKIALTLSRAGIDTLEWQETLTILKIISADLSKTQRDVLEDLLHDAYTVLGETSVRVQAHKRFKGDRTFTITRNAAFAIANAFDLSSLLSTISGLLPQFGIRNCILALYNKNENPAGIANTVLLIENGVRIEPPAGKATFDLKHITPLLHLRHGKPCTILIEPVFFREELLGFIVFDKSEFYEDAYETLRENISSSLKSVLLMKQVTEQAVALEQANAKLRLVHEQERAYLEAIRSELELGREIQTSFLPKELPVVNGWDLGAAFFPAREVSGDFYDAFTIRDGRIVLVISDVSGKDVSAALFMALVRTLIRALSVEVFTGVGDPLDSVAITNRYIIQHHHTSGVRYMYATLFLGIVDPKSNTITYINAGHNPPAFLSGNGEPLSWIRPTGPAVGIMPDAVFMRKQIMLAPGDCLFAYTDGVTESRSPEEIFFTRKRLGDILIKGKGKTVSEIIRKVQDEVHTHTAGKAPHDDITMLALRRML